MSDSPPVVVSSLHIRGVRAEDVSTFRCSATINNDNSRRKSLSVQLNGASQQRDSAMVLVQWC